MADRKLNPNDFNDYCVQQYFKDIEDKEELNKEEEMDLIERVKEDDDEAMRKLIESNLKFVISIAKQYKGRGLSLSDLINEGNLGLVRAAYRFDHTKGIKFISYAVWWVRQRIMQSLNDNSRTIRYPNSVINKMNKINNELRSGDSDEDEYGEFFKSLPSCVSYDDFKWDDEEEYEEQWDFEDEEEEDRVRQDVEEEYNVSKEINKTLSILNSRERHIIESYFGLNSSDDEGKTLKEIGEEYGLTKERIRQIKEVAKRKLRYNIGNLHKLME